MFHLLYSMACQVKIIDNNDMYRLFFKRNISSALNFTIKFHILILDGIYSCYGS